MNQSLDIQFHGDVDEDVVLEALYVEGSGFDVSPNSVQRSADIGFAVAGIVLMATQLAAALWQVHIAHKDRQAAQTAARIARRPVRIEIVVNGIQTELPTSSKDAFTAAVQQAIGATQQRNA